MPGKFFRTSRGHVWISDEGAALPVHIDTWGQRRVLACLKPHVNFGGVRRFESAHPIIPRDQWTEVDLSGFSCPVLDQGQHSSCVGHGACTAFTRAWLMAGHSLKRFSPTYIYGKINGGVDQGAVVSDAMAQLVRGGVCLESTVPEGEVYASRYPPEADVEAARYRMQADVFLAGSFDAIVSGILQRFVPVYGTVVGNAFSTLDAGGVPGIGGGDEGGHCQTGAGVRKVQAGPHAGEFAVLDQNSWGTAWGAGGFALMTESHFTFMANWMGGLDCFLIRGVLDAPADPDNPPAVVA